MILKIIFKIIFYLQTCTIGYLSETAGIRVVHVSRALSYVLQQYLVHYHAERNHRGLDKQLMALAADLRSHSSQARRRDRLGGLLCYYYRAVA